MTDTDIDIPLLPKILGTWNLHSVTEDMNLDFFVMHSSVAGVMGNAGQCNYAAGNTFQDAVAHYRKSLGLSGMSINWSALSLGMAKEKAELETFLKNQGFNYLSLEDIKNCFMQSLTRDLSQVMFGRFDWEKLRLHPIVQMFPHKFSKILSKYEKATTKNLATKYHFDIDDYHSSHAEEQKNMVFELIKVTVGDTFVFDDTVISEETNFVSLGIDSMAAMSFTNFVFEATQVRIPVGKLFADSATVASLISYIREHIPNQKGFKNKMIVGDDKKLLQYLQGNITFMQKMVLDDMKKHNGGNFIYQIDFEISGETFILQGWKKVINHVVKMNPDLRRVYRAKDDGTYESTLIEMSDVSVGITQVDFDSLCQDNVIDKRNDVSFDLTKELPIRFEYACKDDKTRLRLYIHSVSCDLSGVTLFFTDFKLYFKSFLKNQPLPEKNTDIDLADDVRCTRALFDPETKLYWKSQFTLDIKPFTFGTSLSEKLCEDDFKELTVSLPMSKVERVLAYVQEKGLSVYTFVTAAYLVTLRQMTKMDVIPLLNVIDMRSHIPKLNSYVTRGGNLVPFIGDMRNMGKVGDFLKRISDGLSMMTQHSIYPFELIKDEIHSEELKTHLSRHLLAADNMANVNKFLKDRNVSVKGIVHRRCYYETVMIIVYDLLQKEMYLTLGYNSKVLKDGEAKLIPKRVFELVEAFMTHETVHVGEILTGNDFPMSRGSLSDKEVTNDAKQHDKEVTNDAKQHEKTETKQEKTDTMSMENEVGKHTELKGTVSDDQLKEAKNDDEIQNILYEGCFKQHSSDGSEEDVTLTLQEETYSSGSQDVSLSWRAKENPLERKLSVHKISDVIVKEKEGSFDIMLKSHSRWFIFKSNCETKAMTLISKLREAVTGHKIIYKDKGVPVFHV
ncbi:uncharacterized protein LOC123554598 [Mercenaria mercenaria]|uniref:uncharacterized protein LOC123554598 n=1 Tax=Mercenaria mercenaria TaxID=6596 RepID=UPI00234F9BDE|nr:uncharacterized protein LOC123554598 [Mercenaria mercenaria]